jgi:hypothetical protein
MTKRPQSSREPASAKGPMRIVLVIDDDVSMRGGKTMIDLDSVDEYRASLPRVETSAS